MRCGATIDDQLAAGHKRRFIRGQVEHAVGNVLRRTNATERHTLAIGVTAIASGFAVSRELGQLVFVAIVLHKLPEGLAIASLFLAAGWSRSVAVSAAGALGLATVLGVVLTHVAAPLARYGLALAAGVTLYVAASNLVPEFQGKRGWKLPAAFFAGAAVFYGTKLVLERLT